MKFDIDTFNEIVNSLTRNKSRSFLTGFGVFWGLFMLLFMLGGGDGFKKLLEGEFEGFATNMVLAISDQTTKPYKGFQEGRVWNLQYQDADRLEKMVPELDVVTCNISIWGGLVEYDNHTCEGAIIKGLSPEYAGIETPKIKYGRYLNEIDIIQERKVCVIGRRVYEELFPEGGDPCGKFIKDGVSYYQVVGVDFNNGSISLNGSASQTVSIPLSVVQKIYPRGDNIDFICMTIKPGFTASEVIPKIREVLCREHMVDPTDEQALFMLNLEEIFSMMDNLFKGVNFLIWLIGLGTLLAGIIGVSNIMMVTVKERTTEIGIRRAIGATRRDILFQVMMESVALTIVAGMSSIIFTVLILRGLEMVAGGVSFQISFTLAIVCTLLLTVLGIVAGLAPASRAMSIKPVDAMRDE